MRKKIVSLLIVLYVLSIHMNVITFADGLYPIFPADGQQYWVVFREGYRNSRIEMSTCNIHNGGDSAYIVWNKNLLLYNATVENISKPYNQYYLNQNNWDKIGTYNKFTDYATEVIASNLDVYDEKGNLVIAKTDYNTFSNLVNNPVENPVIFENGIENTAFTGGHQLVGGGNYKVNSDGSFTFANDDNDWNETMYYNNPIQGYDKLFVTCNARVIRQGTWMYAGLAGSYDYFRQPQSDNDVGKEDHDSKRCFYKKIFHYRRMQVILNEDTDTITYEFDIKDAPQFYLGIYTINTSITVKKIWLEKGVGVKDTSIDNYITEQVRKYTSPGESAQVNAIINSNLSHEERFRRLNELCRNYGITDISLGIRYLYNPSTYNHDYTYLTTNDNFCAYNYYDWLFSSKGFAARSALYTSGLIFNSEVYTYLDPTMYAESDYPGVKKNKTLLKKIMESNNDSTVSDVLDYSNKTAKYLKNIIKLNNIEQTDELDYLMDRILAAKSDTERKGLQKQFAEKIAYQIKINSKDSIYLDSENFSKALGYSASILNFVGATADDIIAMINLNNDIETYEKYRHFLTTIYNTTYMSWEMRLAAYQLLDDINNGYWKRIQSILGNIMTLAQGFVYTDKSMISTFMEEYIGVSGDTTALFGDALATLKLATFISNIVVDTGDFVKQVAYTQGYAELSILYTDKLIHDKEAFLANETAENAWQFFEDYTMLWNLRYQGEQQYLNMNQIKMYIFAKVPTWNYDLKREVVNDNLTRLRQAKFEMAANTTIPESVQYVKKSVINCPVDVYVYNSGGDLITTLKDGVESNITNEYGRFAVVYQSYSGEYAKVICQSTDEELTIKMNAVSDGLVDYESADANSNEIKTFDKVSVEEGNDITVRQDDYEILQNDGNVVEGTLTVKSTDDYIVAESAQLDVESIELIEGQSQTISIRIIPENTTNTAVNWYSLDESVAKIKNGVVTAVGGGETTIYAKICDSDIEVEVPVKVIALRELKIENCNISDNRVAVNLSANTILDTVQSGSLIIGLYDDNILLESHFEEISVTANENQGIDFTFNEHTFDDINNISVKAFWWNSINSIKPLCKPVYSAIVQ